MGYSLGRGEMYPRGGAGQATKPPSGAGALDQLDHLFIQVARALGAEAHAVLAPDRRENLWDRQIKSLGQLPTTVVALRSANMRDDTTLVVDLDSGLSFGEIPWWVSGVEGMLATTDGARPFFLPPSAATSNVSHTLVEAEFTADGSKLGTTSSR